MDLRDVIITTLQKHSGRAPEDLANMIVERWAFLQELGNVSTETRPAAPPQVSASLIVVPGEAANKSGNLYTPPQRQYPVIDIDVPARIGAPAAAGDAPEEVEYYSVSQLTEELRRALPPRMIVTLPDFPAPLDLMSTIQPAPDQQMKFVSVSYNIPGQIDGPRIIIPTTKEFSAEGIIQEIMRQAERRYSPVQRKVEARKPPMPISMGNVEAILQQAAGDSVAANEGAGSDTPSTWEKLPSWNDNVPFVPKANGPA